VPDESLIDEMRKALRADRERAESRRQTSSPAAGGPDSASDTTSRPARGSLLARLARVLQRD